MEISSSKTIYFIGIGGCGMSAIARTLIQLGYKVAGSDMKESLYTIRLKDAGAKVYVKHDPAHLREADVVVVSTAIQPSNPEFSYAVQEHIPVMRRAEMLNEVMEHFHTKVAVTGTHGKTTGSAMVTRMLSHADRQPTFIVGSDLQDYGVNANVDGRHYVVVESDESDGSFLQINPNVGVILNLEEEHMEYYKTRENLIDHFDRFMRGICDRRGYVVVNRDDKELHHLASLYDPSQVIWFGCDSPDATLRAVDITPSKEGIKFTIQIGNEHVGECQLQCFGRHNVYNALAAAAVGFKEGLSWDEICKGLGQFSGTKRRFQYIGEQSGITIYDDYAHHPTEIETTLKGIKDGFDQRLICIYQPHRYTRTRDLMDEFARCFEVADEVVLTDIFTAGEDPIEGVSSEILAKNMNALGKKTMYVAKKSDIPGALIPHLQDDDLVVTMGAGDITTLGKELLARLSQRSESHD